jgi:hypothetical protein
MKTHNSTTLPENNGKLIISFFDYTGRWAKPYAEAKYPVMLYDKKHEGCILSRFTQILLQVEEALEVYPGMEVYGLLFAPPCTDFAASGARWWKNKDAAAPSVSLDALPVDKGHDAWNEVEISVALVEISLHLVEVLKPKKFWSLENPRGRMERLVPALKRYRRMRFDPCDYGDPYTKETWLWGEFNVDLPKDPVAPVDGSSIHKVSGWNKEQQKMLRSATPSGFAKAFFQANQ